MIKLIGGDLADGEKCGKQDCELCGSGLKGCCHRRAGVVYRGDAISGNKITLLQHTTGKVGIQDITEQITTKGK